MPRPPLFVVGRFPPPYDGQALATARCADVLAPHFDVHRFDTEPPGDTEARTEPRFDLARTASFLKMRGALRRSLAAHPDAPVLWHAISPTLLGHARDVVTTLPAFGRTRPVVAVLHRATYSRLAARALTARSTRRVVRRVALWVVQSEALAAELHPFVSPEAIVVIPNTVATAVLPSADDVEQKRTRWAGHNPPDPLRLLFLSNMIREKGFWDVLEALALLAAQGVAVEARFAGAWPNAETEARFAERVRALQLDGSVHTLGRIAEPAEIKRLHLWADVFALPTYHPTETQPIAVLEAMSAGTPVVTTDREAMRAIGGGTGALRLVPPQSPSAIARAVRDLVRPDAWRLASRAAQSRFESTFSPGAVAARWAALAERAVGWRDG